MSRKKYSLGGLLVLLLSILTCVGLSFVTNDVKASVVVSEKASSRSSIGKPGLDSLLYEFPPNSDDLPLSLIEPTGYHGGDVSSDSYQKKWIGIFKDQKGYYLGSTKITIETCYDPILDDKETDSLSWTGKYIQAIHSDSCIYLISGLGNASLANKNYLKEVVDSSQHTYPSDTITIDFLGNRYSLYGEADVTPAEYSPEELIYTNYKLYLRGTDKDGRDVTQVLATAIAFDSRMFRLLFVGDIDNDGFPDFIIDTSEHYNVYQPTLYLSSFAKKGKLVDIVAIHRSVGC